MKGTKLCPVALVLLLILGNDVFGKSKVYINDKLKSYQNTILHFFVLPPVVDIVHRGLTRTEIGTESELFGNKFVEILSGQLAKTGMQVLPFPPSQVDLSINNELELALVRMQRKYDLLELDLRANPKDIRKGRYSLGDEVAVLTSIDRVDCLVFVRANGSVPTGGMKALVFNPNAIPWIDCRITFADARNGDILGMITIFMPDNSYRTAFKKPDFINEPEKWFEKPIADSLSKIPFCQKR